MSNASEIIRSLGGRNGVCKCPAHDDRSPSLSVNDNPEGGITVHCFAGCDWRAVKAELRRMGLLPEFDGDDVPTETGEQRRAKWEARERERVQKEAWAKSVWNKSQEAPNSPVEAYLMSRGINILSPTLRYHPNLKHADTGQCFPAMVAAITKWPDREIVGVHRTYLQTGGRGKANLSKNKMMAGSCSGGAVRLALVGESLGLAEGIETALSVQQSTGIPMWACLSTGGLKNVVLPDDVKVLVFADGDEPGEKAACEAVRKFIEQGKKSRVVRAPSGSDFNDVLRNGTNG